MSGPLDFSVKSMIYTLSTTDSFGVHDKHNQHVHGHRLKVRGQLMAQHVRLSAISELGIMGGL